MTPLSSKGRRENKILLIQTSDYLAQFVWASKRGRWRQFDGETCSKWEFQAKGGVVKQRSWLGRLGVISALGDSEGLLITAAKTRLWDRALRNTNSNYEPERKSHLLSLFFIFDTSSRGYRGESSTVWIKAFFRVMIVANFDIHRSSFLFKQMQNPEILHECFSGWPSIKRPCFYTLLTVQIKLIFVDSHQDNTIQTNVTTEVDINLCRFLQK